MDATDKDASHFIACYIDLLMRSDERWDSLFKAEQILHELCARLREMQIPTLQVDLVVRRAHIGSRADRPWRDQLFDGLRSVGERCAISIGGMSCSFAQ